jgi:hypothetical protein
MDIPSIFTTKGTCHSYPISSDLQNELDYYSMDNQNTYDDLRRLNSENEQVKQLIQTFGV